MILENKYVDAETALEAFETWQDIMISGREPDSRRFEKEFVDHYNGEISGQTPLALMFYAFVGALDLACKLLDIEDSDNPATAAEPTK